MGKTRKTRNLNAKTLWGIRLFSGLSAVALLAVAAAVFATITVHADARLPWSLRPATPPSTSKVGSTAPFSILPELLPYHLAAEPKPPKPAEEAIFSYKGVASWYGPHFNGRLTANGETFNMYDMTAATTMFHPVLPLGTVVRVTNSQNGRSVVVRITDRGPLPKGRVIDLSYGAARKLTMVHSGVGKVHLSVLHWGDNRYVTAGQ